MELYDQIQEAKSLIQSRWPGQPKVGMGRGTEPVHDHRRSQHPAQLPASRKMIGVGMGVDYITDAQAFARGQADIVVDLL